VDDNVFQNKQVFVEKKGDAFNDAKSQLDQVRPAPAQDSNVSEIIKVPTTQNDDKKSEETDLNTVDNIEVEDDHFIPQKEEIIHDSGSEANPIKIEEVMRRPHLWRKMYNSGDILVKSKELEFNPKDFEDEENSECACYRSKKWIHCSACGRMMEGRVRKQCSEHPKTTFLLDIDACVKCKVDDKMLLKEYEIPNFMRKVVAGRKAPQNIKCQEVKTDVNSTVKTNGKYCVKTDGKIGVKTDGKSDVKIGVKSDGVQSRLRQFVDKRTVTPGTQKREKKLIRQPFKEHLPINQRLRNRD